MVVFDRIARLQHCRLFQSGNRLQNFELHVLRKRSRNTVRIDGVVVQAFGLEENLMAFAVAELDDLVLDRRAVARPDAFDRAGIHGRAAEIGTDQFMRRRHGAGYSAMDLRIEDAVGHQRERHWIIVRCLAFQRRPIDGSTVEARGRPGLEPSELETGTSHRR